MRSNRSMTATAVALGVALVLSSAVYAQNARVSQSSVDAIVGSWSATPREVADKMISKYGLPNEATASMLIWHNNGPWKQTIVYRDEVPHDFPVPHTDLLEQFVDYSVPPEKFDELASYDGSVIVERTKGVISARCDKEPMNILALNLADDIVHGRRTVADARAHYARTAMAAMKGETPPYVKRLRFSTQMANTGYSDHPFKAQSMTSSSSADADDDRQNRVRMRKD